MIQAKDLMLGSLFSYENCIYEAKVIRDNFVYGINKNGFAPGEFPIETIKPIILSEEILLKCGFEKPAHSFYCPIFHLTEWDDFPLNWCVTMNKNAAVIIKRLKYLHELQNLYYLLTKQELEIKQ